MLQALQTPLDALLQFNPFKPHSRQTPRETFIFHNIHTERAKQREHEMRAYEEQIRPTRQANPHSAIPILDLFENPSVSSSVLSTILATVDNVAVTVHCP